jgi:tRNA pseudouridine13 synthase
MLIKQVPEDFIVEELPLKEWDDTGPFAVFRLVKVWLNTEQAVEIISRRFHIPSSIIKYSGTKDKHANTTQYISIPNRAGISDIRLDEDNLKLEHVGYSEEPLSLGTLKGNRFIITLRELSQGEIKALEHNRKNRAGFIVPNYFDEQRFSSNNYNIGLNILKRNYKKAIEYLCESRDIYADTARIYLAAHPNDYIGALQHIPRKTLLMFIHSVQSAIFNQVLAKILEEHSSGDKSTYNIVPYRLGNFLYYKDQSRYSECIEELELIGFDTQNIHHHTKEILESTGLSPRDFIIKALPELSVEGTKRKCFVNVENLEIELMDDRAIVQFELPKGAYATNVLKALTV